MLPRFRDGDFLWAELDYFSTNTPRRGMLALVKVDGDDQDRPMRLLKRIVGLPGENIKVNSGRVSINGNPLEESYAVYVGEPESGEWSLGRDDYFVLGDNRCHSSDSRKFGAVNRVQLEGRIIATPTRLLGIVVS